MSRLDRLLYRVTEAVPAVGSPEVLRRAAVTIGVMAFFRLGKRIPLHGLDYARLAANMGPAASVESANILMLGIAPIASGSLFVMLLNAFPQVSPDLANKEGREGEATLMYVRKAVAFVVAVFMASRAALSLLPFARLGWLSALDVGLTLVCGAMVVAHLAEVVDNSGLGDGLGLYILCEILKGQLDSFRGVWRQISAGMLSWRVAAGVYGCISLLMLAAIHVSQVGKNLEIVSYNIDPMEKRGRLRSEANQLPLRVAPTGVSCLLSLNLYWSLVAPLVARLGLPRTLPYPLVTTPLAVGVAAWALVALDLSMGKTAAAASKNMQQFGLGLAAQPPLVPGEETAAHLQRQSNLAHFVGGAGVGLLCGLATALDMATAARLGRSFGAVSVLLLTGFITTVYRQVSAASVLPRLGRRLQMEQQSLQTFAE